jgi:hypothetical protein
MPEVSLLEKATDKYSIDKDKKIYELKLLIKDITPNS